MASLVPARSGQEATAEQDPPVAGAQPESAAGGAAGGAAGAQEAKADGSTAERASMRDYKKVKGTLHRGNLEQLLLARFTVRKQDTGALFTALLYPRKRAERRPQSERTFDNPFLISAHAWAIDPSYLFLIVDCVGHPDRGDSNLMSRANRVAELAVYLRDPKAPEGRSSVRFAPERARFYAAEIASAMGALHAVGLTMTGNHVVSKLGLLEAILVDADGHIKILACVPAVTAGAGTTMGNCSASAAFIAPETWRGTNSGSWSERVAADWYAYGALVFEMCYGQPVFFASSLSQMCRLVLCEPLRFPKATSNNDADPTMPPPGGNNETPLRDLLRGLLAKKPETRLVGFDAVKTHPYFTGMDWEKLERKELPPPFVPTRSSRRDAADHATRRHLRVDRARLEEMVTQWVHKLKPQAAGSKDDLGVDAALADAARLCDGWPLGDGPGQLLPTPVGDPDAHPVGERGISTIWLAAAWQMVRHMSVPTRVFAELFVPAWTESTQNALWFWVPERFRGRPTCFVSHSWDAWLRQTFYLTKGVERRVCEFHDKKNGGGGGGADHSRDSTWPCSSCTFENQPLHTVCAMCRRARDVSGSKHENDGGESSGDNQQQLYAWLDTFAITQHRSKRQSQEISLIGKLVRAIGVTVLVIPGTGTPDFAIKPISRSWCVYEIVHTPAGCLVPRAGLHPDIDDISFHQKLAAQIATCDVRGAEAFKLQDKAMIDNLVLEKCGSFESADHIVRVAMLRAFAERYSGQGDADHLGDTGRRAKCAQIAQVYENALGGL